MEQKATLQSSTSMESINSVTDSQVRTLFVSGLPMDAKPRELYLLFRSYHGYESSLLKMTAKNGKATSPVGFVTFATRQDADEARKALQGVRFDPDCAQTIRLELARSNTKVTRPKQSPPPSGTPIVPSSLANAMPHLVAHLQPELVSLDHMPLLDQHQLLALTMPQFSAAQQLQMLPATTLQQMQQMHQFAQNPLFAAAAQAQQQHVAAQVQAQQAALNAAVAAQQQQQQQQQQQPSPACSTLFVANLGPHVNEEELRTLFKTFPGFCRIRMHQKGGSAVAFIEYSDVRQATQAMLALQGFVVPSSDRGGFRIEYARNKMADVNG